MVVRLIITNYMAPRTWILEESINLNKLVLFLANLEEILSSIQIMHLQRYALSPRTQKLMQVLIKP